MLRNLKYAGVDQAGPELGTMANQVGWGVNRLCENERPNYK